MTDKVTLIRVHNPFNPNKDRQIEQFDVGFSIQEWVDDNPVVLTYAVVCMVNGEPILRSRWSELFVIKGDVIVFFRLPEGGGGKNPLLAILGIALMVIGTIFTAGLLTIALIGVGAALTIMGAGLLGIPEIPSTDQANQLAAPSPTYSISAQGNNARIGESIPVIYGKHLIYPDFAAQPYSEFIDNDHYLYHVLVIGQGLYDLHKIRIEDSEIDDFEEITWEKIEPNGQITLFNHNVVTSLEVSGQELKGPNLEGDWIGPFIINPSETTANVLAVDISLGRGLYSANDSGGLDDYSLTFTSEARKVDEYGEAVGSWIVLGTETITDNTNNAIRKTFKFDMSEQARYEIRMKRTSDQSEDGKIGNEIRWQSAKAYLTDTIDYGDITLLAVKMRATDNLSGRSSRKINCLVTRKIPIWNPSTGWSNPQNTSSIVWAISDMLKAQYGSKMEDDKIDLQSFYDLDRIFTSRGDYFNAVYDRKMSLWEALKLSCRVGRSAGILQGGIFRIVRDRQQSIPVAMFSTRNIVKNSFSIKYEMASEDTVNGVNVEFINGKSWKPDEVSIDHEGNTPTNPAKVKLFGCTNREQAIREGKYLSRNNIYRRKNIKLSTELEGYIPTFGDLVIVSHDMPQWGLSGDVIGINNDGSISLSEDLDFTEDGNYFIAFRKKSGGVNGPFEVLQDSRANKITLFGVWSITHSPNNDYSILTNSDNDEIRLYYGSSEERTHFTFGISNKLTTYGVIKSIRPRGDLKVELEILAEDNRVHEE